MRECEARSNPVSKKCSGKRLEKGLQECEARSNPISKKCSGKRLEKLLRECEARSNPVSKNVVRIDLRNYCGSAKHAAIW